MSKGTRQVRIGKLMEMLENMRGRLLQLEMSQSKVHPSSEESYYLAGQIEELELCMLQIRNAYGLEVADNE